MSEDILTKTKAPDYASIFSLVQKPSRYIGGEWNAVLKDAAFQKDAVSVCLCFPDLYETGFANTGIEILYRVVNQRSDAYSERAYAADSDLAAILREKNWPFFSLETRQPLKNFDIVGFGLPYELCYTNILEMLDLSQIPLKASDRTKDHPLIIGGGPCVVNPEPLADFFDGFVIGDGEDIIGDIIEKVKQWKKSGGTKQELLETLSTVEGFYVPSLYDVKYFSDGRIESVTPKLKTMPAMVSYRRANLGRKENGDPSFPTTPVVPFVQTVHDRLNVEIQRGCPWRCRFCQAGFTYRPYRERSKDELMEIIEMGLKKTGYDAVTLAGLSAADHTEIVDLLHSLAQKYSQRRISIGLPSTRADRFTLALAEVLQAVRRQTLTFAPEGGTERMRRVIRKELQESEVRETLRLAKQHGWKSIKLYFMYALPTETYQDLDGISQLVADSNRNNRGLSLTVTLSPFVPKPHTPFQWHAQDRLEVLVEKLRYLRKNLSAQIRAHGLEQIIVEGILSRGDRRCGKLLYEVWKLGSKFDEWNERFNFGIWQKAIEDTGLNAEFYCYRERTQDEIFPWDHLQGGPDRRALWNDYQTSLKQAAEPVPEKPHMKERPAVAPGIPVILPVKSPVQRLRFRMSRQGDVRFLSHLEQIEMVRRMIRRADLPMAFTSGFHPQMKTSFGPAISVGYESECELFDVELVGRMDPQQAFDLLAKEAPRGFSILRTTRVPLFFPSLESLLNRVEYEVKVPKELLRKDTVQLQQELDEFLNQKELFMEKVKKKNTPSEKIVKIDLKALILKAAWNIQADGDARFQIILRFGPGKNVKPEKVLQMLMRLTDEEILSLVVNRKAFWIEKSDGTLAEP